MGSGRKPSCSDYSRLAFALRFFVTCVHFCDYPKSKDWAARRIDLLQTKKYKRMFRWAGKHYMAARRVCKGHIKVLEDLIGTLEGFIGLISPY